MTEAYVELPVELSGPALKEQMYEAMEAAFPGWRPYESNPEKQIIDAQVDRLTIPLAQLASDVAAELFYRFGEQIVKVQPIEPTPATVRSTWTMIDAQGYTIKAGTQLRVRTSGNTTEGFRTVEEIVIPPGSTSTEPGEVALEATTPGEGANRLSGEGLLEDSIGYIESIALVGESSGGVNAEEPQEFLSRLTETMKTLAPRPIIPSDCEILARNHAGVARALALDLFNPETDDPEDPETWTSERTISIVLIDGAGLPVSGTIKAAVKADFESKREANFVFFILDATYTLIEVHFEIVVLPGFDQAVVEGRVEAALAAFLAPSQYGVDPSVDDRSWQNRTTLRYQDLVTVVNNQQGVDYYTTLKVGEEGKALGVVDVPLKGPAPLTKAGKIEVHA